MGKIIDPYSGKTKFFKGQGRGVDISKQYIKKKKDIKQLDPDRWKNDEWLKENYKDILNDDNSI